MQHRYRLTLYLQVAQACRYFRQHDAKPEVRDLAMQRRDDFHRAPRLVQQFEHACRHAQMMLLGGAHECCDVSNNLSMTGQQGHRRQRAQRTHAAQIGAQRVAQFVVEPAHGCKGLGQQLIATDQQLVGFAP